ncbi:RRP12-like protein, partial [Trifolium medium]|nr:RRP12-like protein [Trifolium medium]
MPIERPQVTNRNTTYFNRIQKCIGSAVFAMGPERFLTFVPISLDEHSYTYSNIWLVPILKQYITGASLSYYVEHIMPLA